MTTTRLHEVPQVSIFELVKLMYQFIRFELIHAGVALGVFGIIFLLMKPWDNHYYVSDAHPAWFVGPPIVYFTLDLAFAIYLSFSQRNELKPHRCVIWIALQLANLILLTFLGFYLVWNYYYMGNTYLRLTVSLVLLYMYKGYRFIQMYKIIILQRNRCILTPSFGNPNSISIPIQTVVSEKQQQKQQAYVISDPQPTNNNGFPSAFTMKVHN